MGSEQMQSEIAELNYQIEEAGDPRQGYRLVQERIRQYLQAGWAIPEDLAMIERQLLTECLSESQGR